MTNPNRDNRKGKQDTIHNPRQRMKVAIQVKEASEMLLFGSLHSVCLKCSFLSKVHFSALDGWLFSLKYKIIYHFVDDGDKRTYYKLETKI
jgi:hypothetical protein